MTNCNYSEHTKIQRKEIQKQIEELQAKLEELENSKSPAEEAFKRVYGRNPVIDVNNTCWDGSTWIDFNLGYNAAKEDVRVEEQEQGTWSYDLDAKLRKQKEEEVSKYQHNLRISAKEKPTQEQVKKLQEKKMVIENLETSLQDLANGDVRPIDDVVKEVKKLQNYKITDEHGEVNPYKQYLNSKKPQTLYDVIADWWDEIFTNGNPSGQNIESLVEQIEKWLPVADEGVGYSEYSVGWNEGFNYYRIQLMEKLK